MRGPKDNEEISKKRRNVRETLFFNIDWDRAVKANGGLTN